MKRLSSAHKPLWSRVERGFTLVELMVAVVIVGILAGVAYPSYQSSVQKSRRSDAVKGLILIQQGQERYRANNPAYAASLTDIGVPSTGLVTYYTLAITASSATGYTATATAVSGKSQASDSGCTTLTVTVANGTATNTPDSCWSK